MVSGGETPTPLDYGTSEVTSTSTLNHSILKWSSYTGRDAIIMPVNRIAVQLFYFLNEAIVLFVDPVNNPLISVLCNSCKAPEGDLHVALSFSPSHRTVTPNIETSPSLRFVIIFHNPRRNLDIGRYPSCGLNAFKFKKLSLSRLIVEENFFCIHLLFDSYIDWLY
jgi:hypothetical protein